MCCYNRPYDPQDQLTVAMETQSKLQIQRQIEEGKYELVGSYTLDYECSNIPSPIRKKQVVDFISKNEKIYVGVGSKEKVAVIANEIMANNVKEYDAYHVASAIYAECDYFISVDKRLLKYSSDKIKLVTPVQFVNEMEGSV